MRDTYDRKTLKLHSHLRLIEARGVVSVSQLGLSTGQDLVDGQAADVVLTQEPDIIIIIIIINIIIRNLSST